MKKSLDNDVGEWYNYRVAENSGIPFPLQRGA